MQSRDKALYLVSGGISLKVIIENTELANNITNNDFLKKYIPGFKVATKTNFSASLELLDKDISFNYDAYPEIKIGTKNLNEKDIISLIELIFERARQEAGIYCIHSACTVYRGKAVIFWGGASGMGKTRLARSLAENGGLLYSDEKTLVDARTLTVVGGIPYLYLDKNYWSGQIKTKNKDSYYQTELTIQKPVPIGLFVYGFGIDGADFSHDLWQSEKFEWHLYEESSRKIRAVSRRVKNGDIAVPSIDSCKNGENRIGNIRKFANILPCYSLQGSPNSIIEFIKKLDLWY